MRIDGFFDKRTWTITYLVWDEDTRDAVVIDPVLDFDPNRIAVFEESLGRVLARIDEVGARVHWVLDTHAHADHLTGAARLRARLGAKLAMGKPITGVQDLFAGVFGMASPGAAVFDRLLDDGEVLEAGSLKIRALATPGHTPACTTFEIRDALFTGDALFMPDQGTGRCDFPNGSATTLFNSVQRLYAYPDTTRVFVGHDYQPGGREPKWETTIGDEKRGNVHLKGDTAQDAFVAFREGRDRTLSLPALLFQSLQVNIRAGELPPAAANGRRYLSLPIDAFGGPK